MHRHKRPKYPNVRCHKPGHADAPGYAVCIHVVNGKDAFFVRRATQEHLGQIVCALPSAAHQRDDVVLVCQSCVGEHGYDKRRALTNQQEIRDAAVLLRNNGAPEYKVFAFEKTGMLIQSDGLEDWNAEQHAVWDAALKEGIRLFPPAIGERPIEPEQAAVVESPNKEKIP